MISSMPRFDYIECEGDYLFGIFGEDQTDRAGFFCLETAILISAADGSRRRRRRRERAQLPGNVTKLTVRNLAFTKAAKEYFSKRALRDRGQRERQATSPRGCDLWEDERTEVYTQAPTTQLRGFAGFLLKQCAFLRRQKTQTTQVELKATQIELLRIRRHIVAREKELHRMQMAVGGTTFLCTKLNCKLSEQVCARRWANASNGENIEKLDSFQLLYAVCRGCDVGKANSEKYNVSVEALVPTKNKKRLGAGALL